MKKFNIKAQAGAGMAIGGVLVIIIALVIASLGIDTVDASHLGVKNRFGEITGIMHPGMQWTGLFTHVYQYDLRTRPLTIQLTPEDSAATKDGQTIMATIQINWKIKPESVEDIYRNVGRDDQIYNVLNLEGRIKHGFKSVTPQYVDGLDIVNHRDEVIQKAIKAIHEQFPSEYAELEYVVVSNLRFKDEYQNAIDAKKTAEQDALKVQQQVKIAEAEAQRSVAQAEGAKQVRILQADADKYEKVASAEGEATALRIKGEAEASALKAKKQELTPLMVQNNWIDAWKAGGAQVPKWITSDSSGQFLMQLDTSGVN